MERKVLIMVRVLGLGSNFRLLLAEKSCLGLVVRFMKDEGHACGWGWGEV